MRPPPEGGAAPESEIWPAMVVGAGPAGLATSQGLKRRGVRHLVLERGDRLGFTWANLYDSLVLHTGRHLSHLPDMKLPPGTPLFPSRTEFLRYLETYAARFGLPIETGTELREATPADGLWHLTTNRGSFRARTLVVATGIVANPVRPEFPGSADFSGTIVYAANYRRPSDLPDGRVLVVGIGNSGGEIAAELAAAGRPVDVAVRSGANVVPLTLAGIPIQYLGVVLRRLPEPLQTPILSAIGRLTELRRGPSPLPPSRQSPLEAIPLIGFHLVDAIKAGQIGLRPGIARLTTDGAIFTDASGGKYESIVLATGYRPALNPLLPHIAVDAKGFALRKDRVASAEWPNLFFVGHNYDASGGIRNIALDAELAATAVIRAVGKETGRKA